MVLNISQKNIALDFEATQYLIDSINFVLGDIYDYDRSDVAALDIKNRWVPVLNLRIKLA